MTQVYEYGLISHAILNTRLESRFMRIDCALFATWFPQLGEASQQREIQDERALQSDM